MMKMSRNAALLALASVSLLAGGCATQQPAPDNVRMVKIFKTGSNMPVMVPYLGAEHVRYIEATSANRESVSRIVDPPIPVRSN